MKKLIKASLNFKKKEKEYCKLENNKKLYLVTNKTNDWRYFILANNKKAAIDKAKDYCNSGVEFDIPYFIPYTSADFYAYDVENLKAEMLKDLENGSGCGIDLI